MPLNIYNSYETVNLMYRLWESTAIIIIDFIYTRLHHSFTLPVVRWSKMV